MKDLFKNLKKYPLVIYFAIVLYGISIADLFSPVKVGNSCLTTNIHQKLKILQKTTLS